MSDNTSYDSETMGLGELSLFILVWTLNRVGENSILLIEEPETYVSPSSQKRFMDFVAKMSDLKHIWIVLTTHSPSIVEQLPLNRITLLSRGDAGVTVIDTPTQFQLDEILDKTHPYSGILLVEDSVAQSLLRALLIRLAVEIRQKFEILIAHDEGTLSQIKTGFPDKSTWLDLAVIYDGDQRGRQEKGSIRHGYLPTNSSPENWLKITALTNPQRFSESIGRSFVDVRVVLDGIQGLDGHDWLDEIARRLSIPKDNLIHHLVGISLDTNEEVRREAMELVEMLKGGLPD